MFHDLPRDPKIDAGNLTPLVNVIIQLEGSGWVAKGWASSRGRRKAVEAQALLGAEMVLELAFLVGNK